MAWLPDGSALTVMDNWGNAALLDTEGTPRSWHTAASANGVTEHTVLSYMMWGDKAANQKHR